MFGKSYRFIFSIMLLISFRAMGATNTMFDKYENQLALHINQSIKSKLEDLYTFTLQYSQPNELFRLSGRRNFEVIAVTGGRKNGVDYSQYSQIITGLSQDVYFSIPEYFYFGAGLGIYIKAKRTDRIDSNFTFGEKLFVGYRFAHMNIELLARHFSNGSITDKNSGQNFVGLAILCNF